jgi:hypothetical protein
MLREEQGERTPEPGERPAASKVAA